MNSLSEAPPGSQRQRKLLIVTELFHPSMGGMENRYLDLGSVFVGQGWQVDVVTIGTDRESLERQEIQGISVNRIVRDPGYKRPNAILRRNPWAIVRFAWKVRAHLRSHTYDVVIFNIWPLLPQMISTIPAATVAMVDWCEHRSNSFWPVLNHLLARSTRKHIAVSEGVSRILTDRYGIRDIASIPTGIFAGRYRTSAEKQGVLFLGRLSVHKRPEEAIQAVIRARDLGFTEFITVAGSGPQADYLKQQYGHYDFVKMVGRVSDDEKATLLATHRLHLLPSIREGFPIIVAEAMTSGTPTITTNHPDNGTVDIVRQYGCGTVVEPGSESIARAICRLTTDSTEWRDLSEIGLTRSRNLDWQYIYQRLVSHIDSMAASPD